MPGKSEFRYGFKAEAERLAVQYRAELKISKFDPLDALDLAEHLEIPVYSVDEFEGEISDEQLNQLRDTNRFSAMWLPNSDGEKIIVHNNYHSAKRQQSNLMHELAHIILKHEISEQAARLCFEIGLHYYNKEQEMEAKFFGSCLQISKPGLLWATKTKNIEQISDYYNASVDMVQYRINSLGLRRNLSSF
jgi:Zn-dependent peptidase ImmA (M78 family)